MAQRKVLLVEDEPAILEPLVEALRREGFATQTAGTVARALEEARKAAPDLVLLDLMLPDGSGLDVCRELRKDSHVPIIMLTARRDETDRVLGLELGADDYVTKPFSAREVIARIRAVLRRTDSRQAVSSDPIEIDGLRLDPAKRQVTRDGEPVDLARKEFDLLELLMRDAGTVVTRERLIDEVWDVNWFGSTKTLDVHVSALRKKLQDDPASPRWLHTAPWHRLPLRGARGGDVSLRRRLLAAFAYVIVLVLVALLVPLVLNLSRRVDAEVKAEAAGQVQLIASSAAARLGNERELERLDRSSRREPRGPCGRGEPQRPCARGLGRFRTPRRRLRHAAGDRGRARGRDRPGHAPQRHARRGAPLHRGPRLPQRAARPAQ